MLFAGGMGFCASTTCVVTLTSGVVEIVTSFTGTPLQRTPAGHLTQGLVPVILPVLMKPNPHTQLDWEPESAGETLLSGHLFCTPNLHQ
jgi:hypothetical protein